MLPKLPHSEHSLKTQDSKTSNEEQSKHASVAAPVMETNTEAASNANLPGLSKDLINTTRPGSGKVLSTSGFPSGLTSASGHSTPVNNNGVNLSKHLSLHLTSTPVPHEAQTGKTTPKNTSMDPDDLPLSHLVGGSVVTPGDGAITGESIGHATLPSGASTPTTPGMSDYLIIPGKVSCRFYIIN